MCYYHPNGQFFLQFHTSLGLQGAFKNTLEYSETSEFGHLDWS